MTYQIKTPALAASSAALLHVLDGLQNDSMPLDKAKHITNAAGKMPQQVTADLKARLSASKLNKIENTTSVETTEESASA